MKAVGIDIGTTTITVSVVNGENGSVLRSQTVKNGAEIETANSFEHFQSPSVIFKKAKDLLSLLTDGMKPDAIGVTGQMHGILYVANDGSALSPLYTWKDARSGKPYKNGESYTEYLSRMTDSRLAAGFGSATHFYNMVNGLVPEGAAKLCTIHDYIAMRLCGEKTPVTHDTDAASLGLYDIVGKRFADDKIKAAGMDPALFPAVTSDYTKIGNTAAGVPVFVAIGDNQASFIGSVRDMKNSVLVNVGTGSQVSLFSDTPTEAPSMEVRPCMGGYLLVGSSLCGGDAYMVLERFFREVVKMAGLECGNLYPAMDALSENYRSLENKLEIATLFNGTRENPRLRGSINNLSASNFTPRHFVVGVLKGIVGELYDKYSGLKGKLPSPRGIIVGSGNGIRKSHVTRQMFAETFGMQMVVPSHTEEAAYGAALFALVGAGCCKSLGEAQEIIQYC